MYAYVVCVYMHVWVYAYVLKTTMRKFLQCFYIFFFSYPNNLTFKIAHFSSSPVVKGEIRKHMFGKQKPKRAYNP